MTEHTITLEPVVSANLVSANQRIHFHRRAELARYWRALGLLHAQHMPRMQRAHITVTVRYPSNHRRDVGNLYPYVAKPLVDGIVQAGALPDDDDRHVIGPDMRRDPERGPHRVTITIEELA